MIDDMGSSVGVHRKQKTADNKHLDISCLPCQILLSYSVRMWDVRAFAPMERCLKVFLGAQHNFEKV